MSTMLSHVDSEYLWQRELCAGHAYDFEQLQREVDRRVDELLDECVERARFLMGLDGSYEEDAWFANLDAMARDFDVGEADGSAALWPWEEPNLQAARTMASTVPFGRFHPDSVELGW